MELKIELFDSVVHNRLLKVLQIKVSRRQFGEIFDFPFYSLLYAPKSKVAKQPQRAALKPQLDNHVFNSIFIIHFQIFKYLFSSHRLISFNVPSIKEVFAKQKFR
jgi:hypothetical protein